jgi:D-amino-acid dehydrogenase
VKVTIIGAGIVGCACAHALLDEGHIVTILDANGPAHGPSQGNAGWIAHTDILPLAGPKSLLQIPRYLMDPLGPLAIRPAYLHRIAPWFIRFLLASRPARVERSTQALASLQQLAFPAWLELAASLGLSGMIHRRGGMFVYDNRADFEAARAVSKRQAEYGFTVEMIGAEELRQLEPALSDEFIGAAYIDDTAHISDPRQLTQALFEAAVARGAAYERIAVARLEAGEPPALVTEAGERRVSDAIVLAAGIWSRALAASIGDRTPLDTERGYNISFPGFTGLISRPVTFEGHGFIASPLESGLRIGGAVEFAGTELPPNHARTRAMHAKASRFLKGVPRYEDGREWMGFRPSLPDSLPVIGPATRSPRIIHAFGHGHYGMTQSVATGSLVADLAAGRSPRIDLSPFRVDRF